MRNKIRSPAVVVSLIVFIMVTMGVGCGTIGTYRTASTLKPGFVRYQLRPQLLTGTLEGKTQPVFGFDTELRYGIHRFTDFGFSAGSGGLAADIKQRVSLAPNLDVALDPSYALLLYRLPDLETNVTTMDIGLPFIIGYHPWLIGPEFVVAPKLILRRMKYRYAVSVGTRAWYLIPGISAGVSLPLPMGIRLFPEVSVGYSMSILDGRADPDSTTSGPTTLIFNAGLGIGLGRDPNKFYNSGDDMPF